MPKTSTSGQGRPKGTANKATTNARVAIAALVEGNIYRLNDWLEQIAQQDGPKAAWQCFMDVVEYHIPKLARTELTTPDGKPLQVQQVERRIVDPSK